LLLAVASFAGCGREEIRVYRAPKEQPVAVARAPHDHAPQSMPKLEWQLPAGWEERGPGRMSIASFHIPGKDGPGAEVSVMPMPGESASNLSMLVNIVRQGAGMQPITDEQLTNLVENVKIGEAEAKLVDLSGATASSGEKSADQIILVVYPRAGTTWFFKMAGAAALVSAQKGAFLDFLKSIKFLEGESQPQVASRSASDAPAPARVNSNANPTKPQWEVPQTWREAPPTQMVLAKFALTGAASAKAEVTVSVFPGDVGGLLANVNRWRKQIGLAEVQASELAAAVSPLDVDGGKATLVDVSGPETKGSGKARLIGVILPRGGQTWFYKLMGDGAVAEQEKAAFLKFVQTARHPNGA
jgi:hypothetical protein